jgi:hypothetical protein
VSLGNRIENGKVWIELVADAQVKGESPPRRSPDTAWEYDPDVVPLTCHCAAIPSVVQVLCGMAGVIPWHCAARSRPSSTLHPSKGDSDALKRRMATNPAPIQDDVVTQGERSTSPPSPPTLCDHPQCCPAIPGTAEPSPTLWGLMLTGRRHANRCAARAPSSARPSNRCTDEDQTWAPSGPPSKRL